MPGLSPRASHFGDARCWLVVFAGAFILGLSAGCVSNKALALPKAGGPIPVSRLRDPTPAERAYWDQLLLARVIYIAETHNSNTDHEYQLEVLKGLKARKTKFIVGWEMFDRTEQPLLDEWAARRLSTEGLLEKTDFQRHWGIYSVMYEKILRWSQGEEVPSLALNAPDRLSHKLAQGEPLDPSDQALLPVGYQPLAGGYEHFAEQMGENVHTGANLGNFYKAQALWDQTMAMRIVEYLAAHPGEKVVVLLGRGHVDGGFGVPAYVAQKTDAAQLVVYPGGVPAEEKPESGARVAKRTTGQTAQLLWLVCSTKRGQAAPK